MMQQLKRQTYLLGTVIFSSAMVFSGAVFAQSNAFITSGAGGGASSTAKLAAQVAQLQTRLNAIETCGAKSMLYGGTAFAGGKDADNCALGLLVDTTNDLQVPNNLRVGGTSAAPAGETVYVTGDVLIEPDGGATGTLKLGTGTNQGILLSPNQLYLSSTNQWVRVSALTTSGHTLLLGTIGAAGLKHVYSGGTDNKLYVGVGTNFTNPTVSNYNTLVVTGTDRVGVGTDSPTEKLHISGNVLADAYFYTSDESLKENIEPIANGLKVVGDLKPVTFTWKKDGKPSPGFIAQEVEEVVPDVVRTGENGIKSVDYAKLVAYLVGAVQDQQRQIEILREKLQVIEEVE